MRTRTKAEAAQDTETSQCWRTIKNAINWILKDKGSDHRRGCGLPSEINPLTKASSKLYEISIGLTPTTMMHANIHFMTTNVLVKALLMNAILQKDRGVLTKAICFLLICCFDVLGSYLLTQDTAKKTFAMADQKSQQQSWMCFGVLNFLYLCYICYHHFSHKPANNSSEAQNDIPETIASAEPIDIEPVAEISSCKTYFRQFIAQTQLPLKFYFGVMGFFYGIMLGEEQGWPLQLPLASVLYGLVMASTQAACDKLKGEAVNRQLVKYALLCGAAEGLPYYACLRWFPTERASFPAYRAATVAVSTTLAIGLTGNLFCLLSEHNNQVAAGNQPSGQTP